MGVKFLSDEWAKAVTETANSSEAFKQAAAGKSVKAQNVVTTADGEVKYWFALQDGQAQVELGETTDPEATLTADYDTAVALTKGELNATSAYMSGKLKIQGDMMKLMGLQGVFNALPQVFKELDIEY
ncbi:MAG TPA: SCP2 sterol-binding domain-containing protein [Actinomycetota bacterium]|nr:SCP2 sterol-binding domain-containing protein [Actinomycetota bacterium]